MRASFDRLRTNGCRGGPLLGGMRTLCAIQVQMALTLQSLADRARYRVASVLLIAVIYGSILTVRLLGAPDWWAALAGLPLYILLIVITYRRLRDAALSGGWIVLMILVFNFGPEWNGFHLSNLINLLPVIPAWVTPTNSGANPQAA